MVLTGAVFGIEKIANKTTVTPPIRYQAGVSGLPVSRVSHALMNWVEPPSTEIDSAHMRPRPPTRTRRGNASVTVTTTKNGVRANLMAPVAALKLHLTPLSVLPALSL
jgi:hypothetical protein